jgi:hypothetical protein
MASAISVRIVGLELEENVAALKATVDAIDTAMTGWDLRGIDGDLPAEADVKTQLAAYDAIVKPSLSMNDALADVRAVVIP